MAQRCNNLDELRLMGCARLAMVANLAGLIRWDLYYDFVRPITIHYSVTTHRLQKIRSIKALE